MDNQLYCLLCQKQFASEKNLRRHHNRQHQVCTTPPYLCNFCHTGFQTFEEYKSHHSERLLRQHAKKSKKKVTVVPPAPFVENHAAMYAELNEMFSE